MRQFTFSLILLLCTIVCGQTIYGDLTLPPGAFLWLTPDAAAEAMGGASTAEGGYSSAGWANPSAIFAPADFYAGATYCYVREKSMHSGAFVNIRRGKWAGAARLFLMDSGEIEARSGPTEQPDYTFTSHQLYAQLSGAREFADIIKLGASAKWVHERIDQDDRDGWVFDFGCSGEHRFIEAGVSLQNWGREVVFRMFRERYPLTYRAGIAANVLDYGVVRLDWVKPDRLSGWFAIGAEGRIADYAVLRAGYTPGHDTRNISAGIGVKSYGLALDYALVNYSEGLGMSHQVTLTYSPDFR